MRYTSRHYRFIVAIVVTVGLMPGLLWAGEGKIRRNSHAVKDEYIVVLKDDTPRDHIPGIAQRLGKQSGGAVQRVWQDALKGFFVRMTAGQAQGLSHHPDVKYIEENAEMFLSASVPTNVDPACDPPAVCGTADNRLWHLDVLDQNSAVGNDQYSYCETGSGVYVYVVDNGVMRSHREFNNDANKVLTGYDATGDPAQFPAWNPCGGPGISAANGPAEVNGVRGSSSHGTGVASLVGGLNLGVARNAKIVPIKVKPCGRDGARKLSNQTPFTSYATGEIVYANGDYYQVVQGGLTGSAATFPGNNWPWPPDINHNQVWGDVHLAWYGKAALPDPGQMTIQMTIEGLDWILRPVAQGGNPNPKSPAVVTLSTYRVVGDDGLTNIPAGASLSFEDAIGNLLRYNNGQGITVIASANNQDADACDTSPSRMSRNNPANPNDPLHPYKVITAGGTMIRNNPDSNPATGGSAVNLQEPQYDATKAMRLARWRCHAGDSDLCSGNLYGSPPAAAPDPAVDRDGFARTTLGSNGGQCVTLFAPAKNIPVANHHNNSTYRNSRATNSLASGTSWSAPIVAGMAARVLQGTTGWTADDVYTALMSRTAADLDPAELDPPGLTGTPNAVLRITPVVVQPLPAITPAASSGNTNITVTASGPAGMTYQLFLVNASFDVATYNKGANDGTPVNSVPQSSNTFSVPSTGASSYFVRVSSSCGSADTNITTVTALTAPAGLSATATGGTVTVSWNVASGAAGYKVERKIGTAAWGLAQTITGGSTTSVIDTPVVPTGVVLYRVRATLGSSESGPSNNDVACTAAFTDDPIATVAPFTFVKAVHLIEMRQAVNALHELSSMGSVYFGPDLDPASMRTQFIDDAHFTTLMTNLNAARNAAGLPAVGFLSQPVAGGFIDDTHVTNLRAGVK